MKLKLNAEGHAVVVDGKPVYVHDDGKEVPFDAPSTVQTISRLNAEAKSHRERAEAAEGKLKPFEGIEDPAAARKALETVANLDQKKLVDAGEIEKVKAEIGKAFQAKLDEANSRGDKLESQLVNELLGGAFSRSKFIAEKLAIPADIVQATFGNRFQIEDGRIRAKDANGKDMYSVTRPGEIADFEEALALIVDAYPNKDSILKGTGQSGGGAGESKGAGTKQGDLGGDKAARVTAIKSRFPGLST